MSVKFKNLHEASEFMRKRIDVPVEKSQQLLAGNILYRTYSKDLGQGRFTNVFDISYSKDSRTPNLHVFDQLKSGYAHAIETQSPVVFSGGFFFLTDNSTESPTCKALNMAVCDGIVYSLPVVDREALIIDELGMSSRYIKSLGTLIVDGRSVSWSGSLTSHETDVKVFGNGNLSISHVEDEVTGSARHFDQFSRHTPQAPESRVDIGFKRISNGSFVAESVSEQGQLDIMAFDVILRCDQEIAGLGSRMNILTIGDIAVKDSLQCALSSGPSLSAKETASHPINLDSSLGGRLPPFIDRRMARTAVYETEDGMIHFRIYDGRPGSSRFEGISPQEVIDDIANEGDIAWGCFLDPGQSAKMNVRTANGIESRGNNHYLEWASSPGDKHTWVPRDGRPMPNLISI